MRRRRLATKSTSTLPRAGLEVGVDEQAGSARARGEQCHHRLRVILGEGVGLLALDVGDGQQVPLRLTFEVLHVDHEELCAARRRRAGAG